MHSTVDDLIICYVLYYLLSYLLRVPTIPYK